MGNEQPSRTPNSGSDTAEQGYWSIEDDLEILKNWLEASRVLLGVYRTEQQRVQGRINILLSKSELAPRYVTELRTRKERKSQLRVDIDNIRTRIFNIRSRMQQLEHQKHNERMTK